MDLKRAANCLSHLSNLEHKVFCTTDSLKIDIFHNGFGYKAKRATLEGSFPMERIKEWGRKKILRVMLYLSWLTCRNGLKRSNPSNYPLSLLKAANLVQGRCADK